MHQNAFGGRALPGHTGGAYSAPPEPLAELRGRGDRWNENGGRGGKREGKEGKGGPPQCLKCVDANGCWAHGEAL